MDPEIISRAHEITYKEKKVYQVPVRQPEQGVTAIPAGKLSAPLLVNADMIEYGEKAPGRPNSAGKAVRRLKSNG